MRMAQSTQSMQQTQRMVFFLFTMAQVALVLGLFWAFKEHIV